MAGPMGLYKGFCTPDVLTIITHWSVATGRNVKDPTARQPLGAVLTAAARGGDGAGAPRAGVGGAVR